MGTHPSPIAFVLSGGASLGAVQVGMVQALYERGVVPDMIVGTSAGAINGAFLASRPPTTQTVAELAASWRGLRRGRVFPLRPISGLLGFLGTSDHLVPDSGLRELVAEQLAHERLEESPIPLHVVAVDVITGEELLLSEGPAIDAVLASSAIPGVLPPVAWGDRRLMDGGVANNTPISHAVRLGAREIYVLPTGHACALERAPKSALGMTLNALSLLTQSRLVADIELHRGEVKLVVLPPPCPLSIQPIDFSKADSLIRRAHDDARAFFAGGGTDQPPIRMRPHRHRSGRDRSPAAEHRVARDGAGDDAVALGDDGLRRADPPARARARPAAHERRAGDRGADELDADLHVRRGDADRHLSVDGPAGGAVQQRAEIAAVDDAAAVEVLGAGIGLDDRPVLVGPDDPEAEVLGERPGADARVV
jgi:NTE family protein